MAYELACRDLGMDCGYVARGDSMRELLDNGAMHVKSVHGFREQELTRLVLPETMEKIRAAEDDDDEGDDKSEPDGDDDEDLFDDDEDEDDDDTFDEDEDDVE